jgi:hypothetical protein
VSNFPFKVLFHLKTVEFKLVYILIKRKAGEDLRFVDFISWFSLMLEETFFYLFTLFLGRLLIIGHVISKKFSFRSELIKIILHFIDLLIVFILHGEIFRLKGFHCHLTLWIEFFEGHNFFNEDFANDIFIVIYFFFSNWADSLLITKLPR